MPKVVLKLISLILEGVERLVFHFPACPSPTHQGVDLVLGDSEVGDPTEMAGFAAPDLPIFQKIDPFILIRLV